MTGDDMGIDWRESWAGVHEALEAKERNNEMADLSDARAYIDYQIEKNEKMDGAWLKPDEYKWFMEQLIQLEQAEALRRIAARLAELAER